MPVTPTYPGVYIEELPSGVRTIVGVSTSVTAFVGYTPRGPLDEAVRIFNFGDYERHFGGLHRDSLVSYGVQQFFLNGGSDAYVVRVVTSAQPARVTLTDTADPAHDVITVEAASPESMGNWIRLDVDYNTTNPDSLFNLRAVRYELKDDKLTEVESEAFLNLSMNEYSATYVRSVVNSASRLIHVDVPAGLVADEGGYSLSAYLDPSSFPNLADCVQELRVSLDKEPDVYTLKRDLSSVTNIGELVTQLDQAIQLQLAGRLEAKRADATGDDDSNGDYLKLQSTAGASSPPLWSAVRVLKAPANGLAAALQLGLESGGREKEGAGYRRAAPTGTLSEDLAGDLERVITDAVQLEVSVQDHSFSPAKDIISGPISVPVGDNGTKLKDLRKPLEEATQSLSSDHPSVSEASAEFIGSFLRVLPGGDKANLTISLTTPANADDVFRFPGSAGPRENVRQYSLGIGATVGAQTGATPGVDGEPPDPLTLEGDYGNKTGVYALRDVDLFNLLVIPDATWGLNYHGDPAKQLVLAKAAAFCEEERAFLLIDPPPELGSPGTNQPIDNVVTGIKAWMQALGYSNHAGIYFPCMKSADPLDQYRLRNMPASGAIAGVLARTDSARGVWKAPAGVESTLRGVQALGYKLTDQENGVFNKEGINCIRAFPAYGTVVWGARTLEGSDQQQSDWKYIPVRRLALYIEESLYRGSHWVVFEPNDEPLWAQIRLNVGAFMHNLFRQGAFQGMKPREAYFVKCDGETTTQYDIDRGIVNILVGFAPLKPAEFVIIQIQQIAGQVQA